MFLSLSRRVLWIALLIVSAGAASSAEVAGSSAAIADMTGTWDFTVQTDQGSGTPVFRLKQEGEKISGDYKGQLGEAPVTGEISGQDVSLQFTVNVGESVAVVYSGKWDGESFKGTVKLGTFATGTFVGKKRTE
jgi:hypothetical protein